MAKNVKLHELHTQEFLDAGFTAAIVPLGSCESHGDHMPFGTDAITSHALAVKIAEQLESTVVLPPLYLGMSGHYRHKPMCITVSNDTHIRMLRDVLESLHHWGIHRVLMLNGHDGNIPTAEIAGRDTKIAHPEMSIAAIDWWVVLNQMLPPNTFEVWQGWGHAGEVETSIGLALFPELMNMAGARGQVPTTDPFVREFWLFEEMTAYGASGAPKRGTTDKGEQIVKAVIDYMVPYMQKFEKQGLVYNPQDEPER